MANFAVRLALACAAWLGLERGRAAWADGLDRTAALDAMSATITVEELHEHVGFLADDTLEGREAGKRGGRAAARYIENQLKAAGMAPAGDGGGYLQRFNPGYQNLLALVPGTDPELRDEYILVGAHYDHVGYGTWRNSNGPVGYIHNGADDNASGVSALLELVDALHRTQWQPRRSIVIAFWDGEEINLLGSRHWVRQPTVPMSAVRLAVNIDMLGRLRGGRLEVGGTRTAAGLRRLMSSPRLPADMWLDFSWEYKENSDHWPLFMAGVPSLILHTGLHDDYHTPRDDAEKLNVPGMRLASAYLAETICRLADVDELPGFRAASRAENLSIQRVRQAPLPPAEPRLGLTWKWTTAAAADSNAPDAPKLFVESVGVASPAERAGVRAGDQITAVDGEPVTHEFFLAAAVLRAEREVQLTIERDGESPSEIAVSLAGEPTQLGLSWREDDAEPGAVFVTRVIPHSPAARAGLAVHDRIYAIGGEPFANGDALLSQVRQLLAADVATLNFEIERGGRISTLQIDLRLPTDASSDASL